VVYYALLPLYFAEKKRPFYVLSVLAFIGYIGFSVAVDVNFYNSERQRRAGTEMELPRTKPIKFLLIPPIVLGLVLFGAAATFRGFAAFESKKKGEQEANRRRLEAEIALMKSQINPHFLLNTLNNLYALSLSEPQKTPEALYKLSEMVSYILHECASPKVSLTRDLQFVRSYIELQRLRLPPNAKLSVTLPENLPGDISIEPMILIPFIENAFKHGLTTKQPCEICIAIAVDGDRLMLEVENMLVPLKQVQVAVPSGIGMANTRQRLDHSYLGKHQLQVEKDGSRHRVELQLDLA
jgi:LytS/YehU family sensor histidine kinase